MQFAWLDLFGGRWLLLDANFKYPARSWVNKDVAIAELEKEGWTIKPVRKRRSLVNARQKTVGYAMMRTVH
jgi:hypothetical protein